MTARHLYLFAALVAAVVTGCTLYTSHEGQGNGCNFGTCGPDAGQIPPPDAPGCGSIFCLDAGAIIDGGGCNGFGCGSDAGGGGGSDGGCGGGSDGGYIIDGGGCQNCYPDAAIIPPDAP